MKMSKLVGARFKEKPSNCQTRSHEFLIRGGYIKQVSTGIYSLLPVGERIINKIEKIVREEMNRINGQEILLPVVLTADLWKQSGRYKTIGKELLKFKDRTNSEFVLAMTHEEAIVDLVREAGKSYTNYPFMIYQIQTKFRDEPRCRAGLIRTKEFTMKDAYSFHTNKKDLEEYYNICHKAYENIFRRCGIPEVVSVESDSGIMGGNISHEFMLISDIGEDSIAVCTNCDYKSNIETTECIVQNDSDKNLEVLKLVETVGNRTIEDICNSFKANPSKIVKAVVYNTKNNKNVIVFIRGDLEVNETKLRNVLKSEVFIKADANADLATGFIGPYEFKGDYIKIFDKSLDGTTNLICGANKKDFHYTGFNINRDIDGKINFIDVAKAYNNGICPKCKNHTLKVSNSIEVGNIFQLDDKYTKSMDLKYIDKDGKGQHPLMGCYGIGIGRLMASVCEAHNDEFGPIWPISIAPWQIEICAIRIDDENVKDTADEIYKKLMENHIEVLYDDRNISVGIKFAEADLLGIPIRIIVSPKNLRHGEIEVVSRDKTINQKFKLDVATENILNITNDMMNQVS